MSGFASKLTDAAESAARHAPTPQAKVGPDPPVAGFGPSASSLPDLPVSVRPHVDHRALELSLERAAAKIGAGDSARLVALVEETLAGRAVDALSSAERAGLVAALRDELVALCPGVQQRQKRFREQLRIAPRVDIGSDVRRSTVTAPGGTWVFWHSPSPTSPVIFGEGFVPTRSGTAIPSARPQPSAAGITGQPRWRTAGGALVTAAPPLPGKPTLAPSGLSQDALEKAPELVLNEFARARKAALDSAERAAKPLPFRSSGYFRRAGTRITSIEQYTSKVPGGEWDELTVVTGVSGPETGRLGADAMDDVLPAAGTLDPALSGYARMHAWGPILGDETLTGLAYGPHEAVNLLQATTAEAFARWSAKRAGKLNIRAGVPVKVSQYVKYRRVNGTKRPFVRTVRYDYTLEDGTIATAVIDIPPDGKVTFTTFFGGTRP